MCGTGPGASGKDAAEAGRRSHKGRAAADERVGKKSAEDGVSTHHAKERHWKHTKTRLGGEEGTRGDEIHGAAAGIDSGNEAEDAKKCIPKAQLTAVGPFTLDTRKHDADEDSRSLLRGRRHMQLRPPALSSVNYTTSSPGKNRSFVHPLHLPAGFGTTPR